jgi:homoserine O-acetyltransferase
VAAEDERFRSSDSIRNARPLRHGRIERFEGPFPLEHGGSLAEVEVCFETFGELDAERSNAVLVCHAISGDSHAARHGEDDDPGWWDAVVGPGKPVDTLRHFVICPNVLGGCRGTTGPGSVDPSTGRPYGRSFPTITVGDMVRLHVQLLDRLGIAQLLAAVGGSLGGHQVLELATSFPDRVRGAAVIASSPHLTAQALAFDVVGRNAILRDPNYQASEPGEGPGPAVGLAIARMLGHVTYLSREAMMEKFGGSRLALEASPAAFERRFEVGSYLAHQGEKFVERFDANSYVTLSLAMDLFSVGETRADLVERLGRSRCDWLVVSFSSDWLFPPFQSEQIVDALLAAGRTVSSCVVESRFGHDAFLLDDDIDRYGALLRGFLDRIDAGPLPDPAEEMDAAGLDPTSIFHARRVDYDRIVELVDPGASVLDLGCGEGGLLARLAARGSRRLVGLEIDEDEVVVCARRGLPVVHSDIVSGLARFHDGEFDVVILSQTLQSVRDVDLVMTEMLRVGRRCVVSFPNLAFRANRERLASGGRAPVPAFLGPRHWYDTPDVRALSIADFEDYCTEREIRILRRVALDTTTGKLVSHDPNLDADVAVFVIAR